MKNASGESPKTDYAHGEELEMKLTDEDILDAMRHIPGYLDITTGDFRLIYHLAYRHAAERLFGNITAGNLMRVGVDPLLPDMPLDVAAKAIVRSGYKALPVVDATGRVIGMLTEIDFLRQFEVGTFLNLLLNLLDNTFKFKCRCHETPVSAVMTTPAVTLTGDAGFREIGSAFRQHECCCTPVVDRDGRLLGLLLRKDFFTACHL